MFSILLLFILFVAIEFGYFKIAYKYKIIDKPNHRSSHNEITIRGGGIIFSIAIFVGAFYYGLYYTYFLMGLLVISIISFIDDVNEVANKIRIVCHLIAVSLLFYQLNIYGLPFYWILASFIFVIGTINAVNFMDGINGITSGYGLVSLLTLYYVNKYLIAFTNSTYLIISIASVLVFSFFNFRKKAKCFAGDVGSVSLAFIIIFFLLQLIIKTGNLNFIFFLLVYGLDTATTILFRIIRKENVFEAHRSHFYQFLTNEKKIPHLFVAGLYMFVQIILNIIIIKFLPHSATSFLVSIFITATLFITIRLYFESAQRLLKNN